MSKQKYLPKHDFLKSLGFEEKRENSGHPYGIWHERYVNMNMKLSVCAFSDFTLDIDGAMEDSISIKFENDNQLIEFINSF